MSDLRVEVGAITVLRLFDAAYAIDLARVEALAATSARCRLEYAAPKAISFGVAPVEFSLDSFTFQLPGRTVPVEYTARIYDFGVVSILGRFAVNGESWDGFVELCNRVVIAAESDQNRAHWQELLDRVLSEIGPAMERPTGSGLKEDYLIASVQQLNPALSGAELLEQVDLVPLLSGESRSLAPSARTELLRHSLSYYEDDLVALTWDRAFVLEPGSGAASDIDDVLEVANAQLLELRYYDELLDAELPRMYARVGEAQRTVLLGGGATRGSPVTCIAWSLRSPRSPSASTMRSRSPRTSTSRASMAWRSSSSAFVPGALRSIGSWPSCAIPTLRSMMRPPPPAPSCSRWRSCC